MQFTKRGVLTGVGLVVALGIGIGIGSAGQHTMVRTVAGPTVLKRVPGPTKTVYKTVTKNVPGPTITKTKTVYVPATRGPAGTTIARYTGSGSENTGSFSVPASGDYIVAWSYYGNTDPSIGGGTNFAISATNSGGMAGNYPDDIQSSGSGSTEDTGMSGTQSFNVQATGHWDIAVKSAS